MDSHHVSLVGLLIKLGVMAAIAAVLVRSVGFKRYLYREVRTTRQKLAFAAFLSFPLAAGVLVRLLAPNFSQADLSLQGAFLAGLLGGQFVGALTGVAVAVPAAFGAHEWLSFPFGIVAGWAGAVCRHAAPNQEEIWAFSPFIDLELWRWLRNRLDRPFRDWQVLMFAVIATLNLLQIELGRLFPAQIYALDPKSVWWTLSVVAMSVLAVAIPIKIWNNTRIEIKLEEQRHMLVQARLDALTSQINPHFLFNTLNSVASLVRVDPDTARQLIVRLSSILRRLLKKHESYAPLAEELQLIDDYLGIEVVRFGRDKLRVEKQIDPTLADALVPSMLLQPIVENSIRHGLSPKISGGNILLRVFHVGAQVVIEIEDDGVGISPERLADVRQHGIGISNVQERLRVLYGDAARMSISSRQGQGTLIRIELPDVTAEPAAVARDVMTAGR